MIFLSDVKIYKLAWYNIRMLRVVLLSFLLIVLSVGASQALAPPHIIARGFVNPAAHNIVFAAGAGTGSTTCRYLNNQGQDNLSLLFGNFDPNTGSGPWVANGGGTGTVYSFPVSMPMNYAFDSNTARFRQYLPGSDCFNSTVTMSQYPNAWSTGTNGTPWTTPAVDFGSFAGTTSPTQFFDFNVSHYPTMLTFYNNTGDMYLTTFAYPYPNSEPVTTGCSGTFICSAGAFDYYTLRGVQVESDLGANPPNMTLILHDFEIWSISTSLPYLQSIWFNMHTTVISGSGPDANYHLKIDNTALNVSALNGIPMAFGTVSNVVLANPNLYPGSLCEAGPWTPGGSFIIDTNAFAINDSYIVCLNMSAYNGGRDFKAMMRISSATAATLFNPGSLDATMFLISPKDKFFYNVSYSPIIPSTLANFTISVDFGYPMVGRLNYQRTIVNATQPPQTIISSYGTHHSFTIPQVELNYSSVTINLSLEGLDTYPSPHVLMQQPEFTLFATNVTPIFPGVPTSITPYDDVVNHISSGFNVIIDTAPCPICVPPQNHLSIPAICSIDGGPDRGTTLYSITPLNSSSPSTAFVAHWTLAEINGTGQHNVSCRPTISNSFQFQPNATSVNVSGEPQFLLMKLPSVPACDAVALGFSSAQCESITSGFVQNLSYYSAWYCAQAGPPSYPSSYCNRWDGFACPNASVIPPGFAVNGSTANVQCVVPPPSGNMSIPPANFTVPPFLANNTNLTSIIFNTLGMSPYIFLNFISLIVSVIISVFVAIKSHSGLATGVVFMGGVMIFAVVGWLPLWVLIVIVVLTAFVIARFARETIMGGR